MRHKPVQILQNFWSQRSGGGIETTAAPTRSSCVLDFFADPRAWLFCLVIITWNFFLLLVDPHPKLVLGDSATYLHTALRGAIPPDRSFLYGYVIRWLCLPTQSLTPLLVVQAFLGAGTAILVALICRSIFGLSFQLSSLFGFLCAIDPLQLLWQRYIMTETISLFLYALMLLFALLYLKERRLWLLGASLGVSVLLISFRMSYLLVVQATAVLLPIMAFWPEIRAASRKALPVSRRRATVRLACVHLVFSLVLVLALLEGYRELNGHLARCRPAFLHAAGFTLLATWAPALEPRDSPDPRLSRLIAEGSRFKLKDIRYRPLQRYIPGYLIKQWEQIEPNSDLAEGVAKKTAMRALFRHPLAVAELGVNTFLSFWNFRWLFDEAQSELGRAGRYVPETLTAELARYYHFAVQPQDAKKRTVLQRHFLRAQPYWYVVLLSPFICGCLLFFAPTRYVFLLCFHAWILLGTVTFFAITTSVRYLQPMSLLTILTLALLTKASIEGRPGPASVARS